MNIGNYMKGLSRSTKFNSNDKIHKMLSMLDDAMPWSDFQMLRHEIIDEINNWDDLIAKED